MLISLLSALYVTASLTCLLYKRIKPLCCACIFICSFIFYILPEPVSTAWFFIPSLAAAELVIYLGSRRNLFNVILSLTGYLFAMPAQALAAIPLRLQGRPDTAAADLAVPRLLLMCLLAFLFLGLLQKYFIAPRMAALESCPVYLRRLLLFEVLTGAGITSLCLQCGESPGYPPEFPTLYGLTASGVALATAAVFYGMHGILMENLALRQEREQTAAMGEYTARLERLYEDMRVLRHDYRNILATLQDYIDSTDCSELRQYFHETLLPGFGVLSDDGFILGRLRLIEEPALKSLLYTKLSSALSRKLNLSLELAEAVPQTALNTLDLCRILGILLDNAMEAASETDRRTLHMAIIRLESDIVFIVRNSTLPLRVPVSRLFQKDFSTRKGHTGLGLATLTELISPLSAVTLSTDYSGEELTQTLTVIQKKENLRK